jgi:phenylalanyl-tRNA synthetase beta chain
MIGVMGEVHPLVQERYDMEEHAVSAAELHLGMILDLMPDVMEVETIPNFPPVLEDLAFVVDEHLPAKAVEEAMFEAGGRLLVKVRLFDLYRGDQIGPGKKSLAYSLVYQAPDRTLTDDEVAEIRRRIVQQLEQRLGAKLRQ